METNKISRIFGRCTTCGGAMWSGKACTHHPHVVAKLPRVFVYVLECRKCGGEYESYIYGRYRCEKCLACTPERREQAIGYCRTRYLKRKAMNIKYNFYYNPNGSITPSKPNEAGN